MSNTKTTITKSEQATINLGKKLARRFRGGEIIALIGQLGSGKTVLIKGIAQGLGIKKTITSPTFVLMKIYKISNFKFQIENFCHVDAYRLKSGQELLDIGVEEWLGKSDAVTVIEWADRVRDILPKKKIIIRLKLGKKKNERIITYGESLRTKKI
jgi:tRNA threonylcarbamoyladenosine biosynthesis protein TsaE